MINIEKIYLKTFKCYYNCFKKEYSIYNLYKKICKYYREKDSKKY